MNSVSIVAAAMLAMGAAQAQTSTTCSWVASSTPASILHCSVYGALNPRLTDIRHVQTTQDITGCTNGCLAADDCVAFGYNTTTSVCTMYGHNLIQMGLKQQVTGDTLFYNHKCFVQQCGPVSSSTSSASTSTTSPFMTSSSMATSSVAAMTQDSCFSALNHHPKVASSVCGSIDSQTAAPRGFKRDCNGDWTSRLSSVCSHFSASNTKFTPAVAAATTSSSSASQSSVATSTMPVLQTSTSSTSATIALNATSSEISLPPSTIASSSAVLSSSSSAINTSTSDTPVISSTSSSILTSSAPLAVNTSSSITSAFYVNSTTSTASMTESTSSTASKNATTAAAPSITSTASASIYTNTTSVISSTSAASVIANTTVAAPNSTYFTTPSPTVSATSTVAPVLIANPTSMAQNTTSSTTVPAAANTTSVMFSNSTSSMTSTTMQNATSSAASATTTQAPVLIANSTSTSQSMTSSTVFSATANTTSTIFSKSTSSMNSSTVVPAAANTTSVLFANSTSSVASTTMQNATGSATVLATTNTSTVLVTSMPLSTAASSTTAKSSASALYANTTSSITSMPLSTGASSIIANSSRTALYTNTSTSTTCLGCTTSTIVAATTANTISPSALPAASVTTTSSIASAAPAASTAPAAPSFVGPSFYAQIVGDASNRNGNFLVLQSSQQGADTQVDTAFTTDIDSASLFELDSLGHLKIAGNNDQEAFNFFYDTDTAVSEDYLVWDDPYEVATKDRSKPMYCSITSSGELQCMNTHENNEVFTTFFTCNEFSFLGMGIGASALPAGDNCAIVTINVAQSTSSPSSTTATSPSATPAPPTCSDAITSTFYLLANSSATNSSNMNNNQYLVSTLGGGYGYNTGGETYFTDDFAYATPFTILSSGDLVMADACTQDGYWDTYGEVLGFNVPGTGDKEFYTGHPATFYVSSSGTLESDINTEGGYYEQDGAFWVCSASPKLRFDWDQAYEDYGKAGHEEGCDRAVLEVVYPQAGTASGAEVD